MDAAERETHLEWLRSELARVEERIGELQSYRLNGTKFLARLQCDELRDKWRQTIRHTVTQINRELLERLDEAEELRVQIRRLEGGN